jgi:[ribosomal protein S18]-alanine N-acetyltransferase
VVGVITIRPMYESDIEGALAIEEATYPTPWTRGIFLDELAAPGRTYLVAEAEGDIVGYGGLLVVGDEAHITSVTIHPERRGDRLGTRLMLRLARSAIEAGASSVTLEVRVSNEPAQALYRRFGMAPVGVRKSYYRDEDALIMWAHDIDRAAYGERLQAIAGELA